MAEKENLKKTINAILIVGGIFGAIKIVAKRMSKAKCADGEKPCSEIKDDFAGIQDKKRAYEIVFKPLIDSVLSFVGLLVLLPVFLIISIAVYIDDPGPVFFTQERIGKNKKLFELHKFRSMKMSTPHDVPTHQLENPEQYITRVGKILRKYSLDELPQVWDIFIGNMSIIGPRPALWNQEDLVAERDKYGANHVKPGLTGWAQINGRDELEIADKAKLDGEYVEKLRQGGLKALFFDVKCFLGTIFSVIGSDGVVEGGTGELHRAKGKEVKNRSSGYREKVCLKSEINNLKMNVMDTANDENAGFEDYGYRKHFEIDLSEKNKKRVLITGAGSYIGKSFENWAREYYPANFTIDTVDMQSPDWREKDFSSYDAVFHVAGIAHADVGKVSEEEKKKYYEVNTDLAIETAQKAKAEGVRQFILMSSMIIYGDSAPYGKEKIIDEHTVPHPANFYGDSKWQADKGVRALADEDFHVAVLRPPMIYGKGSKGNYQLLTKLAKKLPVFPDVENRRSMLYIDNLCEFLCKLMLSGEGGVYFPQNAEWTKTSDMVKMIAGANGKKIIDLKALQPVVAIGGKVPGKIGELVNKAFGNSCYAQEISVYPGLEYRKEGLSKSISMAETFNSGNNKDIKEKTIWIIDHYSSEPMYGGISRQYDFAIELGKRGYHVVVIASGFSHFTHSYISDKEMLVNELMPNVHYIYLKTSEYQENGGAARAKNMIDFMLKVEKHEARIAGQYGRPDVVNGCSVHPLAWIAAYKIAKKYGVRYCIEVRDFWPRIWVASGDKKNTDPMVLFFGIVQKWAYRKADRIIYSMFHGDKYICGELGYDRKKTFLIGQPMDCERFDANRERLDMLPENIREFMKDGFICSFAGYYMTYEGVYVMLEAAKILKKRGIPIKMVFVGSGQEQESMRAYAEKNNLNNVLISERIAKEAIPALLGHSDICMAHLEVEGHKEVYKYGVSKNKVNEYLYSGACTLYGFLYKDDAVAACGGGMVFEPYNTKDLADKIEQVFHMSESDRKQYGVNGRKYIKENHSVQVLTDRLLEVLFGEK